ncbi:MAG: hypothetical protein J5671_05920 [Bacteroidaceae bacterium]|nr:hypothetical protein [Bacteroidaceae bacterium]
MKRIGFFLVACLYVILAIAQEQTYETRVVDADTGEPMPCVGVYIETGRTTLTNFDGEFSIKADSNEVIRLTCIGYRTLYYAFAKLPPVVRMEPLASNMSEVTIRGLEHLLLKVSRCMEKDFRRKRTKTSQYFYRQTTVISRKQDVVETFIKARSACNLRNLQFLSGRHGTSTEEQWKKSIFANMNLHHVLELGVMTQDVLFWKDLITPLQPHGEQFVISANRKADRIATIELYQKYYNIDIKEVTDEGRQILRINMQRNEDADDKLPIMTGILYVDAKSLQTLSFDGQIENMVLQFRPSQLESIINTPVSLDLHIDYRYEHGFAEVADIGMQIRFDNFQTRTMLFNVNENNLLNHNATRVGENMLASIDNVSFDSIYWTKNEIIKRTREEERIAEGFIEDKEAKIDSAITDLNRRPPLEQLAERARLFGERIPQEKVYVQLDNTCYFLSDTIWFSAFTRRTNSGRPSRISRVLYAELWNHDGYLVERKLVEMRDGRGSGFFALPDTLYSGYFELRAYTRWQLNWGQTEHPHSKYTERSFYNKAMAHDFFRDYEKLYSRVFPVYDKPREEGVFSRDMTLRPLRRYFKTEPDKPKLLLSLFPEGGNMVEGVPCCVAFEAAMQNGEAREGELRLMCDDSLVTTAHTEHRGRGSFTFTPIQGRKYKALFTSDADGMTASEEMKNIETNGVSLQVIREDSTWRIDVRSNLPQPLGISIMHEGVTSHFVQINNEKLAFNDAELPAGVNQVTVFDGEEHVWADRLFFVTKEELMHPMLSISGMKERYEPYERAELEVHSPSPSSSISLAVRDAALQDHTYDTGNIMTEMLLASEIKGFVPQPEWYFEKDDEEHRRGLELLMMTQGWRRFNWRDMAVEGQWEITHPAEQTQMVTGTVNKYEAFRMIPDSIIPDSKGHGPNYLFDMNVYGLFHTGNIVHTDYNGNRTLVAAPNIGSGENTSVNQYEYNSMMEAQNSLGSNNRISGAGRDRVMDRAGRLKKEVKIHAEFVKPDAPSDKEKYVVGEMTTQNGAFRLEFPHFYGDCIFFLTAKDTTLWNKRIRKLWMKKYQQHNWIQMEDDEFTRIHEDAEFYVRLNFPYPRWVKPYTYYQMNEAPFADRPQTGAPLDDKLLNEITVRARRNGLRRLDLSKPVYVIDAYEAANAIMDAGLLSDPYSSTVFCNHISPPLFYGDLGYGNTSEMANVLPLIYMGDMNMYRLYDTSLFWDSVRVAGKGVMEDALINHDTQRQYSRLEYIDKVYIYSDYSPRMEGSKRYVQDDQPSVEVSLHKYPNNERRVTYRDRRYILPGFAYQEDFYHPDYHRNPPREGYKDYRRTLYWNPDLQLDSEGKAHISFFTGTRPAHITVEANGISPTGSLLHN